MNKRKCVLCDKERLFEELYGKAFVCWRCELNPNNQSTLCHLRVNCDFMIAPVIGSFVVPSVRKQLI